MQVRPLAGSELALVDSRLPLHRLDQPGDRIYLIAWDGGEPVGHAHLAWEGHGGEPEIQDVFVLPNRRREGIGSLLTAAAERETVRRGHASLGLTVSITNEEARRLYERLGYETTGEEPHRVSGTIVLRGRPVEVDDSLLWLRKRLKG